MGHFTHTHPSDTLYPHPTFSGASPSTRSYLIPQNMFAVDAAVGKLSYSYCLSSSLWPPYVIGQAIIFLPCGVYTVFLSISLSFFFFPHLISAVADWMSAILRHMHGVAQCEFRMQVWNVLHAIRWKCRTRKNRQKVAICAPSLKFVGLYLRN